MFLFYTVLMVLFGYLYGSVNYAIIITRLITGKDIRLLGNKKPGTANVARSVGKGWATLVLFLDMSKSLLPLVSARRLIFTEISLSHYTVLFAIAVAAIGGHCMPLYYRFKGGGGIAVSLGVFLFFIPAEFVLSIFIALIIVLIFIKRVRFRLTQWEPIMFVIITPVLTLILNLATPIRFYDYRLTGGHPWYIPAGVCVVSLFILLMNLTFMKDRFKELGENTS